MFHSRLRHLVSQTRFSYSREIYWLLQSVTNVFPTWHGYPGLISQSLEARFLLRSTHWEAVVGLYIKNNGVANNIMNYPFLLYTWLRQRYSWITASAGSKFLIVKKHYACCRGILVARAWQVALPSLSFQRQSRSRISNQTAVLLSLRAYFTGFSSAYRRKRSLIYELLLRIAR